MSFCIYRCSAAPPSACDATPSNSDTDDRKNAKLEAIEQCAAFVAMNGPESAAVLRERFAATTDYEWLFDDSSVDYKYYEHRVAELTSAKAETDADEEPEKDCVSESVKKRKRSRWGSASDILPLDADLMQYAMLVYGTVELEERQWRQLQDQRSMRMLTGMAEKRMKRASEMKYEYDSDEDVDGGTWEHKRRMEEMERTKQQAHSLTAANEGKSHIGDFLPPDQLSRFLRQWERIRSGKPPGSMADDYEQFKLTSSNTGFKMMERMGWREGQTLGSGSQPAISEPVTM
jgi:splicing factor 4